MKASAKKPALEAGRASYLCKGALSRRRSKTTRSEEGYLAFATMSSGQRVV